MMKKSNKGAETNGPRPPKQKRKITVRSVANTIAIVFLSLALIGCVSVFFMLSSIISSAPEVTMNSLKGKDSTQLYDDAGNTFSSLGEEQRESVDYEDLPQSLIDAFLAIEDSRYFKHNGFDLPRFISSGINNLTTGSLSQGGSTLTMQAVDNAVFAEMDDNVGSMEKIKRKIQEIWLSMEIENELSKKEIIELYLNKINFGGPARGIQKGSEYYFGKDASQLTLSESAFLAGVINAPNLYNPYSGYSIDENGTATNFYENAVKRRDETLDMMEYHGYISETECALAKSTKLAFQLNGSSGFVSNPYLAYIDRVEKEVKELTGKDMYTTPMRVYTSMNRELQEYYSEMQSGNHINFPDGDSDMQFGSALLNNQTGEIVALLGGRGDAVYAGYRNNRAIENTHQLGSSVKPLIDYVLTFEKLGYATSHIYHDGPRKFGNDPNIIHNASGQWTGDITTSDAVGRSLNGPAIEAMMDVLDKIGQEELIKHMAAIGYEIPADSFNMNYAIGGEEMISTPLQLAGAYQIFANKGVYIEPHAVKKVELMDGSGDVYETEVKKTQVVSEESAWLMSQLLNEATSSRFSNLLQILQSSYPVYAKSGTSDYGEDGLAYNIPAQAMKDKWIAAYTSEYTIATWAGYDSIDYNHYFTVYKMNVNVPGQVNHLMLDKVAEVFGTPAAITRPSGVTQITHVKGKYPYASVPEGTPSDMITTGWINTKYAKLETLSADPLEALQSFKIEETDTDNVYKLSFSAYPDAEKLKPGSHTQQIEFSGGTITGNVFYDPRLLYGEVVYKIDISQNNTVLNSYTYTSENAEQTITGTPGETYNVCGYYSYKNTSEGKSNEICYKVTLPKTSDPGEEETPSNPDQTLPPTNNTDDDD